MGHSFLNEEEEKITPQISEISYSDMVRVLPPVEAPPEDCTDHVLTGAVPADSGKPEDPLRFLCEKNCMMCSGNPSCGGGGPPPTSTERAILVKSTFQCRTLGGHQVLADGANDPWRMIPIFDEALESAADDDGSMANTQVSLCSRLHQYRVATGLHQQRMAFHIYKITRAPALKSLEGLEGKLIAIPVPLSA